jgi:rhodanese-related sulfurtransferase
MIVPISFIRLTIIAVGILAVAGVDGAMRGLRMPPEAGSELPAALREALTLNVRDASNAAEPPSDAPVEASPQIVEDPSDGKGMTTAELHVAWQGQLVHLVDARLTRQFEEGHIPGALSIPFEEMASGYPAALDTLPIEGPTVVYCDGGDCDASRNVASLLMELGYQNVSIFERGMEAWTRAGFPVESGRGY